MACVMVGSQMVKMVIPMKNYTIANRVKAIFGDGKAIFDVCGIKFSDGSA